MSGPAWRTRLTELLGVRLPVIQGGLAHLARAPLCAAVSEAGGLGQVTAVTLGDPAALAEEIAAVRAVTARPFGVNLAIGHTPIDPYLEVALEAGVPVLTVTGGNPERALRASEGLGVIRLVLVAGVRAARKAADLGADGLIAVGAEGGGHLGRDDVAGSVLWPLVAEAVPDLPVAASGGIVDGYGLAAALVFGLDGVEMGTRFVATRESPAHEAYKAALVAASERDTRIIERTAGRPGRVLAGPYVDGILDLEARSPGDLAALLPHLEGGINRRAALDGELAEGFVWAGQGAGRIRDVPTVGELLARIDREARAAIARASACAPRPPTPAVGP
jgi:NAD(P)H-dependent flavin oxidoreductase YrpB (nitropropane dioxygenase family)